MNDPEIRTRLHAHFDKQGAAWVDEITLGKRRVDMVALVDGLQEVRQGKNARRTGALVGEFRAPNSSTAAQGLRRNVVENRSPLRVLLRCRLAIMRSWRRVAQPPLPVASSE
jgi:hypothetical protein